MDPDPLVADSDEGPLDPIDQLHASAAGGQVREGALMDFVRVKVNKLNTENKELKARVADLESTLAIVQTAQKWSEENSMTPEQAAKVKEVTALLMEARSARQEALSFSKVGKGALYEEIRKYKAVVRKERVEKKEMKQRLTNAFQHSKQIKDEHARLLEKQEQERQGWRALLRKVQDRHREEMAALQQAVGVQNEQAQQRMKQVNQFGERVMKELTQLQDHLHGVKEDTMAGVLSDEEEDPNSDSFFITQPAAQR
jgi:cell division septum initiation protein DivIVA